MVGGLHSRIDGESDLSRREVSRGQFELKNGAQDLFDVTIDSGKWLLPSHYICLDGAVTPAAQDANHRAAPVKNGDLYRRTSQFD